jgi:hypothetical protein
MKREARAVDCSDVCASCKECSFEKAPYFLRSNTMKNRIRDGGTGGNRAGGAPCATISLISASLAEFVSTSF